MSWAGRNGVIIANCMINETSGKVGVLTRKCAQLACYTHRGKKSRSSNDNLHEFVLYKE